MRRERTGLVSEVADSATLCSSINPGLPGVPRPDWISLNDPVYCNDYRYREGFCTEVGCFWKYLNSKHRFRGACGLAEVRVLSVAYAVMMSYD